MSNLHSEQHLVNELAVKTLKAISKEQAIPYSRIKKIFSEGDKEIAKAFWIMLRKISPIISIILFTIALIVKNLILERKGRKIPW
ncbi:hypothetical protein N3Z16_10800 (plasmid) [Candidatus Megaera polyxenophila]|uniref:hypothetical protein n=1 Tax=Candidatus Megaera polyxenophila TaxID=988779 RepID=UPI00249DB3FA|nr:hypothetical protein N3Z16_10800 [Candidatus Megaera polyxenophila]